MLREHFPYAAGALLFGALGANDLSVFTLVLSLVLLWLPIVYMAGTETAETDRPTRQQVANEKIDSRQDSE